MTIVIAEAGVNHNGCLDLAFELVDAAHAAGADVIKFQTFKADKLVTKFAHRAQYQTNNTGNDETQYEMLEKLELSGKAHLKLNERCKNLGIEFLSTAFDSQSLYFLKNRIKLRRFKIPSGEITNAPLLLDYAYTNSDIILSTGMSDLGEIENALAVLAFGLTGSQDPKSQSAFKNAFYSPEGQLALQEKVTLLHCTTEYPAAPNEINLLTMDTLRKAFGLRVGYSDHSEGIVAPIAAAARGASIIEKHFTLDRSLEGPDHKASIEPEELSRMVEGIRLVKSFLGIPRKIPAKVEIDNRIVARKSLVAAKDIKEGELFTEDNLTIKRPGSGQTPFNYWSVLGSKAKSDYKKDDLI